MDPIHFTELKLMSQSPAHYRAAVRGNLRKFEKGTALHSMILGGQRAVPYPGKTRQGAEYKAFVAANPNTLVMAKSEYEAAAGMADAVRGNSTAMELLTGAREVEIEWSFLGRSCAGRVDCVGGGFLTELKSAVSSHPDRFAWQARKLGYGAQLAWYQQGLLQAGITDARDAYVVAVETKFPHVVTILQATPRMLERGRKSYRLWMERVLSCEAENHWPGYVQGIVPLDVPDEDVDLVFPGDGGGEEEAA